MELKHLNHPIIIGTWSRSGRAHRLLNAAAPLNSIPTYKRRHLLQKLFTNRASMALLEGMEGGPHWKIIDSHLHVWASPEQAHVFPYFPGQEPTIPGSVEVLLSAMKDSCVDGALIVQPINHKFDHSYVTSVMKKYPGKFVGCCLANPAEGGDGILDLEQLVNEEGYQAVRFNPYLWPMDQKMTNDVGKALFAKAGQLGIPVGFMCFKGLHLHIAEIEQLCSEYPETTVLIDHFGFCKPPKDDYEKNAWESLLSLSRFPQVYIKVSATFRISREEFPYKDTWPLLEMLVNKFGAQRLLWGSDFPFVVEQCGYSNARNIISLARRTISLSDEDAEWIMGKTAMSLFKSSWV